jgi:hypothetical protein
VPQHDIPAGGQPETGTLPYAAGREKWIARFLQRFFIHSRSVVTDRNHQPVSSINAVKANITRDISLPPQVFNGVQGIENHIHEYLIDLCWKTHDLTAGSKIS